MPNIDKLFAAAKANHERELKVASQKEAAMNTYHFCTMKQFPGGSAEYNDGFCEIRTESLRTKEGMQEFREWLKKQVGEGHTLLSLTRLT